MRRVLDAHVFKFIVFFLVCRVLGLMGFGLTRFWAHRVFLGLQVLGSQDFFWVCGVLDS